MVKTEVMRDIALIAAIHELVGESKVRDLVTEEETQLLADKLRFLENDKDAEVNDAAMEREVRVMFREAIDRLLVAEVTPPVSEN